jgi:hypothetical protein
MDLADLKRLATAAREFSVQVGAADAPRHITLRVPTQHELVVSARRSGIESIESDRAAMLVMTRALVLQAMVGFSGVVVGDVLPDHPQAADALPCEPGAAELVLDAQPEWAKTLSDALMERLALRREQKDTAQKN